MGTITNGISGLVDRLRGASDWPKTAEQCEQALARFDARRQELEAIIADEEQRDLERSFSNPRVKGTAALQDAQLEIGRLHRKIELVGFERDRLRDEEATATLAAKWNASEEYAAAVRKRAARIDGIVAQLVNEALALSGEIAEFDQSVPAAPPDWARGLNVFEAIRQAINAASGDTAAAILTKMGRDTLAKVVAEHLTIALRGRLAPEKENSDGQPDQPAA